MQESALSMCRQNWSSRLPWPPDTISRCHKTSTTIAGSVIIATRRIFQIGVPRTGFLSASGTAAISRAGIRGPVNSRKVVVQLSIGSEVLSGRLASAR